MPIKVPEGLFFNPSGTFSIGTFSIKQLFFTPYNTCQP